MYVFQQRMSAFQNAKIHCCKPVSDADALLYSFRTRKNIQEDENLKLFVTANILKSATTWTRTKIREAGL